MIKWVNNQKQRLGARFRLTKEYIRNLKGWHYDYRRYRRNGLLGWRRLAATPQQLEAQIIKEYHAIEKGLAMPKFRPRFGEHRVRTLQKLISNFRQDTPNATNKHVSVAIQCLKAYCERHQSLNIQVDDLVDPALFSSIENENQNQERGGVDRISVEDFFQSKSSSFAEFLRSRRSCRTFRSQKKVEDHVIQESVKLAIHTPSVCNRQAWRVHHWSDRDTIDQLLKWQNGNRGFGEQIPCLLAVTVDLRCFDSDIERYQYWIDGGMFGMSLLLALHSLGLGAVPLNWSAPPSQDLGFRQASNIPDSESVIMLIGVGYPADELLLPQSERRPVEEVLNTH